MQTEFSKGMSLSAPGGFLRALTAILRDLCVLGFFIADPPNSVRGDGATLIDLYAGIAILHE
jgi:hypothetical protein